MPLRLNALLCRSYTCPCQCSATPQLCYSVPLLRHSLHYYSMPLLRYARLDLSVQCLSDTILIIASAQLIFSVPSPCLSMPMLVLAIQCLRRALPCPCAANPCFAVSVQRHLDTQLSHCRTSLINASAHPRLAYPCLCSTHLFVAMP